jgi:hypothetical protein
VWEQVSNPRGSTLRKIQDRLQQRLGFAFPLVKGRGIFQYNFGLLPHRRPITTFVGAPVVLPKIAKGEITDALINECHERYKAALLQLFNTYKSTFAPHRKLIFVTAGGSALHTGRHIRKGSNAGASSPSPIPSASSAPDSLAAVVDTLGVQPLPADAATPAAEIEEQERLQHEGSTLTKRK